MKMYRNLYDTYQDHVARLGEKNPETDRIRRHLEAYRRILEERGRTFGPSAELIE